MKVYTHKIKYENEEKCCTLDNHRLETKKTKAICFELIFSSKQQKPARKSKFSMMRLSCQGKS